MKIGNYLLVLFVALALLMACSSPPPGLSSTEEILLDSLYNQEIELLSSVMDSLCEAEKERVFRSLVDSIAQQRLSEIYQIID